MMLTILLSIIGVIVTIIFVIGTHEAGHFIVARLLGIKVLRFSIGFGKTLWHKYDKNGTEYVFALIPLGGYVKMLDENEGKVPPEQLPYAFNRQPFYKKFLIVLAGPFVNLLCAFILYWLILMIGFVTIKPIIGEIKPQSIAAEAGLKPQQEIISMDNEKTRGWSSVFLHILAHVGDEDRMTVTVKNGANQAESTHVLDLANWHLDELNPDPLESLGIKPYEPPIPLVVGIIAKNSPASASLKIGDKIISVDNQPITKWKELITLIANHPNQEAIFKIERDKKIKEVKVRIGVQHDLLWQKTGFLGIGPNFKWPKELQQEIKYSPSAAIPQAFVEMKNFTYLNLLMLLKMITGKLSLQSLGGPITIFESAGSALTLGFLSFISFLGFLSISIGVINLLPIPGLDGGHLCIQIIELIIQKPLPVRVLSFLYLIGFLVILFALIQALVNDILRLI